MTREEQIEALSKVLLKLISEEPPKTQQLDNTPSDSKERHDAHVKSINETLNDFKMLGVDVDIVRKIMRRVDEVYGEKRTLNYTRPLYEDFDNLTGNNLT